MRRTFLLILFIIPSLLHGQDLKMVSETLKFNGEEAKKESSKLYLTGSQFRSDSKGGERSTSSIFDEEQEVLYIIDHEEESYQEITQEQIDKIRKQMEKMQKRLEQMPEEQRQRMEQMMGDRFKDQSKIEYEKTGNSKKIAPWGSCSEYEGKLDGKLMHRVYTADMDALELNAEHFDVFRSMIDFLDFLPDDMENQYPIPGGMNGENESNLEGLGVRWIHYDGSGKKTREVRIKEISNTELEENIFEVPDEYKKSETQMGGMPSGGRR